MELDRNKVKSTIKKTLFSKLKSFGFTRWRSQLTTYRMRGDFVDVLFIQIGRSPGSLYLHYYTALLANPFTNLLSSNSFGFRLGGMEVGDRPWLAENEEELQEILDLIYDAAQNVAIPLFDSLNDFDSYLKVLKPIEECRRPWRFGLAVLYTLMEQNDVALQLCHQIKKDLLEYEFFNIEKNKEDKKTMQNLEKLILALSLGEGLNCVNSWKLANEEELKNG